MNVYESRIVLESPLSRRNNSQAPISTSIVESGDQQTVYAQVTAKG